MWKVVVDLFEDGIGVCEFEKRTGEAIISLIWVFEDLSC